MPVARKHATPKASALVAPSRKWIVAQVTALGSLAVAVIQAGGFSTATEIIGVGLVVTAVSTYVIPNA